MEKGGNTGHLELIRRINRSLILNTVKERQPVSRAQIARLLGLSKTTVSTIVDELVEKKLIVEHEKSSAGGAGRPSVMLGFNPKSAFCIGVDIASADIHLLITDLDGDVGYEWSGPTKSDVDEVMGMIEQAIEAGGVGDKAIFAMGVGVPGIVADKDTVVSAKSLGWSNLALGSRLRSHFHFPVFVGNGVNLAALGERWLGSGGQVDDMLFVRIGTGLGSALICGGQLISGANGSAGEIGFFLDSRDVELGELNHIGRQGVLERKCSGAALSRGGRSAEELFAACGDGEPQATAMSAYFIRELSVALANSISLLNPARVVIGGSVAESMGTVIGQLQDEVARLTPIRADICLASLGARAGALGAIDFAVTQIEQQDIRVQG